MTGTLTTRSALLTLVLLAGCPALTGEDLTRRQDRDGDGALDQRFGGTDCDDDNRRIHPKAAEECDGFDNDCDDLVNEADPELDGADWYLDADGDGQGDPAVHQRTCAELAGRDRTVVRGGERVRAPVWVHDASDCDDTDPDQFQGQWWLLDGDGDGYGTAGRALQQCSRPAAFVVATGYDPQSRACAELSCDCDDADRSVRPGAVERCNGFDDDCDGAVDAADAEGSSEQLWYRDQDGDGFGDASDTNPSACPESASDVANAADCDDDVDGGAAVNPGVTEDATNDRDDDCNPNNDHDHDGDGVNGLDGDGGTDCDDTDPTVYPGAPERCDGYSQGCVAFDPAAEAGTATFYPDYGDDPGPVGPPVIGPPLLGADVVDESNGLGYAAGEAVDYTALLHGTEQVKFSVPGELRLCGGDHAPFTAGIRADSELRVRGLVYGPPTEPDGPPEAQPERVTFELDGRPGIELRAGGSVSGVRLVDGGGGPACLSVRQATGDVVSDVRVEGCAAQSVQVLGSGRLTVADVTVVAEQPVGGYAYGVDLQTEGELVVRRLRVSGTVSGDRENGVVGNAPPTNLSGQRVQLVDSQLSDGVGTGLDGSTRALTLRGTSVTQHAGVAVSGWGLVTLEDSEVTWSRIGVSAPAVVATGTTIEDNDTGVMSMEATFDDACVVDNGADWTDVSCYSYSLDDCSHEVAPPALCEMGTCSPP